MPRNCFRRPRSLWLMYSQLLLPIVPISIGRLRLSNSRLQNAMLHFPGDSARHFFVGNNSDGTRPLVTSEPLTTPRHKLGFQRAEAIAQHNDAVDPFTPLFFF